MAKMNKYYCPKCKKTSGRRDVTYSEYDNVTYCRWCNHEVMFTENILDKMICDYAEYLAKKGKKE